MLASDGRALGLLKKEYPHLASIELPGYNVHYKGNGMIWNIGKQLPKISRAIFSERRAIKKIVQEKQIDIIISDNRYGCRNKNCKNIFMTHQVNIAIPNRRLEIITNKINQQFINRFDECWIPDFKGEKSLAGKLSISKKHHYIGPLSRFKKRVHPKEYDLIAVLSGPEPQRSILEEKIIAQLKPLNLKALIVQGKTEAYSETILSDSVKMISFLTSEKLNEAILKSNLVLARSGYSTIMDLVALQKKAILIPTPGQTEQEYLAERLHKQGLFYYQEQSNLNLDNALSSAIQYSGFQDQYSETIPIKGFLKARLSI